MTNTAAVFQLPCAPREMIFIDPGPVPFDADIRSVATLTVTCGANRRIEIERFGTELAAIASERLQEVAGTDGRIASSESLRPGSLPIPVPGIAVGLHCQRVRQTARLDLRSAPKVS